MSYDKSRVLGKHYLAELVSCEPTLIDDPIWVQKVLLEAAHIAGATVIGNLIHKFSPQGVSGVVVIAESHISIHSWPEWGVAAIDFFSCSDALKMNEALLHIKTAFQAKSMKTQIVERRATHERSVQHSALGG